MKIILRKLLIPSDTISIPLALLLSVCLSQFVFAKDTDIYSVNAKQNAYVLMDSSGSMNFGVYEHKVDYGAMYDTLFTRNDELSYEDYIYDPINGEIFYNLNDRPQRNKIYLLAGIGIGVTVATVDGTAVPFAGDAADPSHMWDLDQKIDTHTIIDENGNLVDDDPTDDIEPRLTVDAEGYILFDGQPLPMGLSIKAHDFVTFYDLTVVDNGFNGLMQAPGNYFSGYKVEMAKPEVGGDPIPTPAPLMIDDADIKDIYFFVTGNWISMQALYNLEYTANPVPQGAGIDDPPWKYEPFTVDVTSWSEAGKSIDYPEGDVNYLDSLKENQTIQTILEPGAKYIQVHFSTFDVQGDNSADTYGNDYITLYGQEGTIARYDNDNSPLTIDSGWSPIIKGDIVTVKLASNNDGITGAGYTIDKIRAVYSEADGPTYIMQSRMNVAKDAMIYVVDAFRGKMNWGFASFAPQENGASVGPYLNPVEGDDAQRAAIVSKIDLIKPDGGTPLMEALQDVWNDGYWGRRQVLEDLLCRRNYIISMTDGFPSFDDDNARIADVTFADSDADNWTQDPYQGLGDEPDYYDDVAHWIYTHSWLDKSEVADPANSYVNVITHHIAFGANHPLLQDAAGESGGEYIVAYNKQQLIAAFHSLALLMSEAISFTAPVVSVDAVNKIQSGDDLYMGLFLPQDINYWAGNIKKFKVGDGASPDRELFMIYDRIGNEAIDADGNFLDNTAGFWGDDNDDNDKDVYGAADIKEDGVGEVLLEDVQLLFDTKIDDVGNKTYWNRAIYTYNEVSDSLVKFDRSITPAELAVADEATRDKLVNFVHGYTYDAITTDDDTKGDPKGVREWVLGSIIHSRPVVVDYFDTSDPTLPLVQRYIAVGSNDGMLHIFDDTNGKEVFAFIPDDILPKLQLVQANKMYDTVDGLITLYRRDKNPTYLIFGERRGGGHYWCLDMSSTDPQNWTVAWKYSNNEIEQSWSEVKISKIPINMTNNGEKYYKDVAIFTGGYDPEEDLFPEPFLDEDSNGTPILDNGQIDNAEWTKADPSQDINGNGIYDSYNPAKNEHGRGIWVVDIDNPDNITEVTLADGITTKQILPFSVTYGDIRIADGANWTLPEMKFSFPASPAIAAVTDIYYYLSGNNVVVGPEPDVLSAIYATDIYANLYKITFNFSVKNNGKGFDVPDWRITEADWLVNHVFSGNPGSTSTRAGAPGVADTSDQGRKVFYAPSISWGGSEGYFEAGNYYFPDTTFTAKDKMASLFFGTGDREHPEYTMIRNRFYGVYDDSSVSAKYQTEAMINETDVPVSSAPYTEQDLLNLTCDELGRDSVITSCYLGALNGNCDAATADTDMKAYLKSLLHDDAVYSNLAQNELEYGATHENDAKGWYIVLADQGQTCSHMSYPTLINNGENISHDNHDGEQILSQPLLYYGTLYFTSYQASVNDPCNPQGNGFTYAISYLDGSATYDLTDAQNGNIDFTDRYKKFTGITGLPSGFTIINIDGKAGAMASMGGALVGPGPNPNNPFNINTPGAGLELFYWRDSNSQED